MRRDAERYAALFSSSDVTWAGYTASARQSVDALGVIGLSQAYPIILSGLERFPKSEMIRLLWLLECIAVRHQLVGRKRPGRVESLGSRAAREIYGGKLKTTSDVFSVIRELYVPDDEFRLLFENHEEGSGRKARYLLTGIERQSVNRDNETLNNELIPYNVTLEHIFPRSPSNEWMDSVKEDKEWDSRHIRRLGNLCLLPSINHALGNKTFAEKRPIYKKSKLNTTRNLEKYEHWTRAEILERQRHMATLAVAAWRFQ